MSVRDEVPCEKFVPRNGHARTLTVQGALPQRSTTKAVNAKTRVSFTVFSSQNLTSCDNWPSPTNHRIGNRRDPRQDPNAHRIWLGNFLMTETGAERLRKSVIADGSLLGPRNTFRLVPSKSIPKYSGYCECKRTSYSQCCK